MSSHLLTVLLILLLIALPVAASSTTASTNATIAPVVQITIKPVTIITVATTTVPTTTVSVTTTATTGVISIASVPSGAVAIIDGAAVGTTPYTIRTLTTGTHTLVLQLSGYEDYSTTFAVSPTNANSQTYTLVPVTTTATTTVATTSATSASATVETRAVTTTSTTAPVTTITPVKTTTPVTVPSLQGTAVKNLTQEFGFSRAVSILPLTIRVGNHTKTPFLTTYSPYFRYQLGDTGSAVGVNTDITLSSSGNLSSIPTSYIEVDSANVYLKSSSLMSNAEVTSTPVWGDEDTVYIAKNATFYNNTNFRWTSMMSGVTGFYQISRYPFDTNATHWQNQYVSGLVSSGPVEDVYVDSEGFHYFTLNFAPVANHDPGDPPFYTGVVQLDTTVTGQGTSMSLTRIPFTGIGIYSKKTSIGPVTLSLPAGITTISSGKLTEAELGYPNENVILSSQDYTHLPSALSSALLNLPQTYYVRVVPIRSDGTAGVPTVPVTVTVIRPEPCPDTSVAQQENLAVKPPSAEVMSFYMTLFVPDWIHTDQNGDLESRIHFVTVTSPPACSNTSSGGVVNADECTQYGGSEPGYHFYADPAESHWYDSVWEVINGLFMAINVAREIVYDSLNYVQDWSVQVGALTITALTLGQYDCQDSYQCTTLLNTVVLSGDNAQASSQTNPMITEIRTVGRDYMARVIASELETGEATDSTDSIYSGLPSSVVTKIKGNSAAIGHQLADAVASETGNVTADAAGDSFYIPDPLYYEAHPAMAIIRVTNPNIAATDPVYLTVKDSDGLFKATTVYVPSIEAYGSTVIPVTLEEDYSSVYTETCNAQSYTSTCGDICIPCYWNLWYYAVIKSSKNGGDMISVSLTTEKDGYYISLTPSSSGQVISSQNIVTVDGQGNSCGAYTSKTVLKYPAGWNMQLIGQKQDLKSQCWLNYTFTNGATGRLIT